MVSVCDDGRLIAFGKGVRCVSEGDGRNEMAGFRIPSNFWE